MNFTKNLIENLVGSISCQQHGEIKILFWLLLYFILYRKINEKKEVLSRLFFAKIQWFANLEKTRAFFFMIKIVLWSRFKKFRIHRKCSLSLSVMHCFCCRCGTVKSIEFIYAVQLTFLLIGKQKRNRWSHSIFKKITNYKII